MRVPMCSTKSFACSQTPPLLAVPKDRPYASSTTERPLIAEATQSSPFLRRITPNLAHCPFLTVSRPCSISSGPEKGDCAAGSDPSVEQNAGASSHAVTTVDAPCITDADNRPSSPVYAPNPSAPLASHAGIVILIFCPEEETIMEHLSSARLQTSCAAPSQCDLSRSAPKISFKPSGMRLGSLDLLAAASFTANACGRSLRDAAEFLNEGEHIGCTAWRKAGLHRWSGFTIKGTFGPSVCLFWAIQTPRALPDPKEKTTRQIQRVAL